MNASPAYLFVYVKCFFFITFMLKQLYFVVNFFFRNFFKIKFLFFEIFRSLFEKL